MSKKLIDCCLIQIKGRNGYRCGKFSEYIKDLDPKIKANTQIIFAMTNELDLYCPFISTYGKGIQLKWCETAGNQVRVIIEPDKGIIYFIKNESRQSELYYRSQAPDLHILSDIYERVNV